MKVICRYVLPLAAMFVLLCSCGGRDIIPRSVMADIYADMFLADQWLADHTSERTTADTTLFYDPILARYGYTFEQYDNSVKHYLKDPERFSKIFRDASEKLKNGKKAFDRKKELADRVKEFNAQFRGYGEKDFKEDTLLWQAPITDSVILDSLRRKAALRDSILRAEFVRDSTQRDSLLRDSIRRQNARLDSALNAQRRRVETRNVSR